MIRLNVIAEGDTEQNFINQILRKYLAPCLVFVAVRRVETKKGGQRGGMTTYRKAKNDLLQWMKEDQRIEARFTTMFDLYALPKDFPGFDNANKKINPYERIEVIETSFKEDIEDYRFIPYIQLYEYEALILSEPDKFESMFPKHERQIANLKELVKNFESPELINDGKETAPSKRIIKEIPTYKNLKKTAGVAIAEKIGLEMIRKKCPHFDEWLNKLETLSGAIK